MLKCDLLKLYKQEHILVQVHTFKGISDKKNFASLASNALKRSWLRGLDIFTSMMEVHSSVTSKSLPNSHLMTSKLMTVRCFLFPLCKVNTLLPWALKNVQIMLLTKKKLKSFFAHSILKFEHCGCL